MLIFLEKNVWEIFENICSGNFLKNILNLCVNNKKTQLCSDQSHFHRISVENAVPETLNSVNLIVENSGGLARVPWREKRGDAGRAWMYLNLMDFTSEVHWDNNYNMENVTFSLKSTYDNPGQRLKFFIKHIDYIV